MRTEQNPLWFVQCLARGGGFFLLSLGDPGMTYPPLHPNVAKLLLVKKYLSHFSNGYIIMADTSLATLLLARLLPFMCRYICSKSVFL